MKSYCYLTLLFSCSLHCFGEDTKFQIKHFRQNEDLKKCDDPKTCESSKWFEYSERHEDTKRFENTKKKTKFLSENYSGTDIKHDVDDSYEYVGNPDFFGEIVRPCRVYDLNCIRRYFADHSKCKIRRGPLPENVFRSQFTYYIASANHSTTLTNVRLGGFRNTRIEEFFINKETNKMVFSIQMRNLTAMVPTVYFQFFRNGREPIVTVSEAYFVFSTITFTAIIPNIDDLQLEKAEVTAFADALPVFGIGPEVANNPDPVVARSLDQLISDVPTITQEFLLTDSLFYPPVYIQHNICDFGLKVI